MIQEFKKVWKTYTIGMLWLLGLLWPLLGIHPDGTLSFDKTLTVWLYLLAGTFICFVLFLMNKSGSLSLVKDPISKIWAGGATATKTVPTWVWLLIAFILAILFPQFTGRYHQDVAINVLVYVCLGLGLNVVVGLAGMLDLGYIAFYGVGAYTYALFNIHYNVPFWVCLPISGALALFVACIVGYPTLRMRGDYLAIVTLGFGEIIRIILNNWMDLTNGPNGIMGINRPGLFYPSFADGFSWEHMWIQKLWLLYYVALGLAIITIIAVHRLNFSRVGRAWESIREDETAAELMGVNTFIYKLLAYAMGGMFAGVAGAFFASRMKFVSPESFTFLESAMVLCMVVLGGMGSIPGIILGAAALIVLPEVFRQFELYRMLAFGAVMIIMMLFRPEGLIPAKRMGTRSEEKEG
ncbi:MAG: high-affinity branched-chain amino acid ABC transporter permease LivM [Proteobacteria bacterium]|nr:high-affinity branched-chain amino acid ABC transporter permease LivM [Pseudomonadota bacterium]MBU1585832.1 high-affinity branched-chain amino acid ABC transporter permease LivM [Pseudomonadota bacterium]MBU2455520.1 high-affinity branched-chain amino acid ABC transporter permease LivM [Pseudomonadota bacterium]MBU2628555.1 high-affinity branched-chain amino acid ABC transporter permease LivM [Pseudomonadota bacterium]